MNKLIVDIKLKVKNLDIKFDHNIEGITFITGLSGSGKTALVRCITGLDTPDSGEIFFKNSSWFDSTKNKNSSIQNRNIGYVRQGDNLFSHMTVSKNIEYGLKRIREKPRLSHDELVNKFKIEHLLNKKPFQLSGGEKQRVAMVRAILTSPELLIFDEPMSALDYWSKQELFEHLNLIKNSFNIPMLYVSHSLNEYENLANSFIVIENGQLKKQGISNSDNHPFN